MLPASTPRPPSSSSRPSSRSNQAAALADQLTPLSQSRTVPYSSIPSRLRPGISRSYSAPQGGDDQRGRADRHEIQSGDYSEDEGEIQGFVEEVTAEDGPQVAGMPRSVTMSWLKSYGVRSQKSVWVKGEDKRHDQSLNGHGGKAAANEKLMQNYRRYLAYYFPFLKWVPQYSWSYLRGDLVAAFTMASFYIPMSLSYASNLSHVPPINGLYSFVFQPLIYALLGTSPQMVVGPEAAGSLLVGSVVRTSVDVGLSGDEDDILNARIAGLVTCMSGAVIFVAGLTRLGFLDSVLSRPLLRGFISAIGFVILADQLIPEMGLSRRAKELHASHGSSVEKLMFLAENVQYAHRLTCGVAFASFIIIMILREIKKRLQPRYPSVAYIPDRFTVVVLSAILTRKFCWDEKGLEVLGKVQSSTGSPFAFHWPFQIDHMSHIREAMGTSFLIALLGFFESSVASKSLPQGDAKPGEGIQGITLSPNRELVALGAANLLGGCFGSLPAFGGYGRSKVNAATGGRTAMSSVFLSMITITCVLLLMPYFHFLPKAVLSSMISVVAYSLIEEAPHDINFFIKIRGWSELFMMFLIFTATIFYSLSLGIALGCGLSVLSVIRHATKPRIQILGKVPGRENQFENAENNPQGLEFVEGCLIVKIPEPLTFANTGDLKTRLQRLEHYGSSNSHPALPRARTSKNNENIIFDIHGVTALDGSGTQVLTEIVENYVTQGVRVFFCRGPNKKSPVYHMFLSSGITEMCGGGRHFVETVDEALKMTKASNLSNYYRDNPAEGSH